MTLHTVGKWPQTDFKHTKWTTYQQRTKETDKETNQRMKTNETIRENKQEKVDQIQEKIEKLTEME